MVSKAMQIIVGKTREGKYEITAVRFEWKRLKKGVRSFEPTREGMAYLKSYISWRDITRKLKDDWIFQDVLKNAFDQYL